MHFNRNQQLTDNPMKELVPVVKDSYKRCMGGDVIGRFYEIFLASHPSISPLFEKTDFNVQKGLLKQGIHLAIMFAEENPFGQRGIDRIRETHSRSGMNIAPHLYRYWKTSFLQAVAETDTELNDDTRKAWDLVLQHTIDYIVAGYNTSG